MHLSDLERPFICTSLTDATVAETLRSIRLASYHGARAFEVHLPLLDFPATPVIENIVSSTPWPVYATVRRSAFYSLLGRDVTDSLSDQERIQGLTDAVKAGCAGVDFEMDTFDPQPGPTAFHPEAILDYAANDEMDLAEISDDTDAIAAQQAAIDTIHDHGGEVILSAHTYKHISPDVAVEIAQRATDRGADFLKLVGVDRTMEEGLDTLNAHLHLNQADVIPYSLMAIGDVSRIIRPIAPMFGSAWVFAQPELVPGGFHDWPLVENAREILRRIDWRSVSTS